MAANRKSVLFICTGNSCRSQMAEAILRHIAGSRIEALSAGSRPAGFVHPLALQTLHDMGIPAENLSSKHWSEVMDRQIDVCITVCDNASAECPTWPYSTAVAHWALPDPAFFTGNEEQRRAFARTVAQRLHTALTELTRVISENSDSQALAAALARLPVP